METQDKSSTERVKNDKNMETLVNSTANTIKINNLTQKHKGVDDKDRTSKDLRQACALIDKLQDPLGN